MSGGKRNFRAVTKAGIAFGDALRRRIGEMIYERGDYVKVEFADETTGIGEWMWMIVDRCDDQKRLVYGKLDNEPLNDYGGRVGLGSELAVSYSQIREHRKSSELRS